MRRHTLGYPNQEARQSLADYVLYYFTKPPVEQINNAFALYESLRDLDMDRLHEIFHSFFASIPYDWYKEQQTAGYEAYYASIVYCYFAATGIDVRPEVHSNKGRLDLLVRLDNRVYVIEFKVVEQCGEEKALERIKSKGYAEQFAGREIYLIGVEFSSEKRNIESFEWEKAG
ncbi:MAG: PD-(D/E)XK nuclease domain-containing protein [Thermodesulfobacteriota bacterium]